MGQWVPYGPRTPTAAPGPRAHSACVTGPTSRIVCSTGPSPPGSPLIEIGTSPTPNAYSMLNWPGRNENGSPGGGSSSSVTTSADSRRAPVTRQGAGRFHRPGAVRSASGSMRIPVHVVQAQPGGLEPLGGEPGEALHEVEAHPRVIGALGPQARTVQRDGADRLDRAPVELPAVRFQQPREPGDVTGAQGLHDDRAAAG